MKKLVYTAQSKHLFYAKNIITAYALEQGVVALNPFNLWDYFLGDSIDRDVVREANNEIVRRVDEVWVFGPIADGVALEIKLAIQHNKELKFFSAGKTKADIYPISIDELEYEDGVKNLSEEIKGYVK